MVTIILICDGCDVEGNPGCDRYAMSRLGWTVTDGQDLCRRCT